MAGKKSHKAKHQKAKHKKQKGRKDERVKHEKRTRAVKARTKAKPAAKPARTAPARPAPPASPGKPPRPGSATPPTPAPGGSRPGGPAPRSSARRSRRSSLAQRRGPNGELLAPGDLLLPGGAQRTEEVQYLFRGCVAAERPVFDEGVLEVIAKRGGNPDATADRPDLERTVETMRLRFEGGSIEPLLPTRAAIRRNFSGVVERAKHRRREIGAFLRGLDLGHTETSHMDSHGEASLQSLMEWAARLENLADADEPDRADYNQFHRGLDQLENTTEALILDVEQTLRRLRDRSRNG